MPFICDRPVLLDDVVVATHLFYIAQEAVNNAIKHGRARHIAIALSVLDDDGLPRDPGRRRRHLDAFRRASPGMGLHIMRYRANMIGGTLDVTSRPGRRHRRRLSLSRCGSGTEGHAFRAGRSATDDRDEAPCARGGRPSDRPPGPGDAHQPRAGPDGLRRRPRRRIRRSHAIASLQPDIVILDISLGGPDGLELLKQMRARDDGSCRC